MSFDWGQYLEIAQAFQSKRAPEVTDEALERACTSKAYYSAFNLCRNFLERGAFIPRTNREREIHKEVREAFLRISDNRAEEIEEKLNLLRTKRNKADYEDNVADSKLMATHSVILAKQVATLLKGLEGTRA